MLVAQTGLNHYNLTISGYEDGSGCSGNTYKLGVVKAMQCCAPAIFMFENVTGVADSPKTPKGKKQEPAVEASV